MAKTIKGTAKADKLKVTESSIMLTAGKGNDTITVSGGKKSTVRGQDGNDTITITAKVGTGNKIYGDAGVDTIKIQGGNSNYYYGGTGNDKITLSGGKSNTIHGDSGNDTITVTAKAGTGNKIYGDAGVDTIKIQGANSNYYYGGAGNDKITLSGGKSNTIHGDSGNDTITVTAKAGTGNKIYGDAGVDTINGNSGNDCLYGGNDNDYLYGNSGSDRLEGGNGNDTLFGGDGSDYLWGDDGHDWMYGDADSDYMYGGNGSDWLEGGDGDDYLYGGNEDDWLWGDNGDDHLYGSSGDDYLYGGNGNDTFCYENGHDTIWDYEEGEDTIRILYSDFEKSEISGNDIVMTFFDGGTLTISGNAKHAVTFIDSDGDTIKINPVTQQSIMQKFMASLDNSTSILQSVENALNTAVNYASNGRFRTWNSLINSFLNDIRYFGAWSDSSAESFLQEYCGINLSNDDTGSITGSDAGGIITKTAESIVPENGTIYDLESPYYSTTTINGLTFHWPNTYSNSQRSIINGIYTWWAKEGLNLIEESYGLSFNEAGTTVHDIDVNFYSDYSSTLAYVQPTFYTNGNHAGQTTKLSLNINMSHYNELLSDVNGKSADTFGYLDRTLAHELTHAVMAANITGFSYLPKCLKEGSAELVSGIDDERTSLIRNLAKSSNIYTLEEALTNDSYSGDNSAYAGGYMLLRYFAKQSAADTGTLISTSNLTTSYSFNEANDIYLFSKSGTLTAVSEVESASLTDNLTASSILLSDYASNNNLLNNYTDPLVFFNKNNGLEFI